MTDFNSRYNLIMTQLYQLVIDAATSFLLKNGFKKDADDIAQEVALIFFNKNIQKSFKFTTQIHSCCVDALKKFYSKQCKFESKIRRLEDALQYARVL